ncbi:MAG TPA: M15 family metallopeptidase [Longimicrobium sp.]|nr:M15 family metallopeptidase [Longimicrobium sp.]
MSSERALRAALAAGATLLAGCRGGAQPHGPAASPSPVPASIAAAPRPACDVRGGIPAGAELVDVTRVDPTIRTDIRYATANNFTGRPLPGYESARALMRPGAARALARVQARLRPQGLGLKVFDAYRPIRATLAMVEWAGRTGNGWVLEQGYVARYSGHNRGNTVDLTLVDLDTGRELEMGTAYDTFSEAAHTANATGQVMENRMRLQRAIGAEGFQPYDQEWWHFRLSGDAEPLDYPIACYP